MSTLQGAFLSGHHLVQPAFTEEENNHAKQANAFKAAGGDAAGLCCLLWGSAIPFINLGYRYFGVSAGDTATQILFGGCRFFLAGFLTILFESVARKSPAFPKEDELGQRGEAFFGADDHSIRVLYIGVAHTRRREDCDHSGASGVYVDFDCLLHLPHGADEPLSGSGGLIGVARRGRRQLDEGRLWRRGASDRRGFVIISMVASACSTGLIKIRPV